MADSKSRPQHDQKAAVELSPSLQVISSKGGSKANYY